MNKTGRHIPALLLLLPIGYLSALAKTGIVTGATYLLFPELAALAYSVFAKPNGAWAKSPLMVAVTPAITALSGIAISQSLPYGLWSIALCISSSMLAIRVLRSPVAPAISAALLPLTLGVTSWWYPISVAAGTIGLALLLILVRRFLASVPEEHLPRSDDVQAEKIVRTRRHLGWAVVFTVFIVLAYELGEMTNLRLVLFPPLAVIAFEMLAHADTCPWALRPWALPLVSTLAAALGVAAVYLLGCGPASVGVAMVGSIFVASILRLHLPPALAIGLLPQVISNPDWYFVLSVAIGALLLTCSFLIVRAIRPNMLRLPEVASCVHPGRGGDDRIRL